MTSLVSNSNKRFGGLVGTILFLGVILVLFASFTFFVWFNEIITGTEALVLIAIGCITIGLIGYTIELFRGNSNNPGVPYDADRLFEENKGKPIEIYFMEEKKKQGKPTHFDYVVGPTGSNERLFISHMTKKYKPGRYLVADNGDLIPATDEQVRLAGGHPENPSHTQQKTTGPSEQDKAVAQIFEQSNKQ